ncbi:uncharacterized protein LOC128954758 [Oppia nitens]|uniref:uncharacterized protein LOC128954758 n=1 Tax=Oppia nitens TaxID=1686743 RepID=UPI0023DCABFD|nr:uncharacterized protein LOC128954758 [Oppia nitens]
MSFFDRLRSGVQHIETEVKQLREMVDNRYQRSEDQLTSDLMKAKRFDQNVRNTYAEITYLYNTIKASGPPLAESAKRINTLKQMVFDIEDNSGIKDYGYKPFSERYSQDDDNDNDLKLGSAINSILTPPNTLNNNNREADSFLTVEFTPGLTTKRPKGISRVNHNNNYCHENNNNEQHLRHSFVSGPTIASSQPRLPDSVLNYICDNKVTPEQPIQAVDVEKSVKLLRSIAGNSTPQMPKTRVNINFHNQILNNL